MATTNPDPEAARAVQHLREDHVAFERRFDDLRAHARSDDWRYLDSVWDGFVDDLEEHFVYEEEVLFPELRRSAPDGSALALRLSTQHEQIRADIQLLGVQIQLHSIRASTIESLLNRLQRHAAVEDDCLYGWAERSGVVLSCAPLSVAAGVPTP
jgi:hemerythrin superfamily protein